MPKVAKEHGEARRRQIIDAAYRCFARKGFHQTTMRDIYEQADSARALSITTSLARTRSSRPASTSTTSAASTCSPRPGERGPAQGP